jgi:hypothetical protein
VSQQPPVTGVARRCADLWALITEHTHTHTNSHTHTHAHTRTHTHTHHTRAYAHMLGPGTPWYYYAMGYGTCKQGGDMCHGCGYGYSWIGVWKSDDMSEGSWELLREARADDGKWPSQVGALLANDTTHQRDIASLPVSTPSLVSLLLPTVSLPRSASP